MNKYNVIQGKMVQKNNKWNISDKRAEEITHRYIVEILNDSNHNMLSLSDLVILLNQRTKHIKFINNSKKKPLSVYLRCNYGSIINFLDKFATYGLIKKDADIQVKLMNIVNEYNGWILVDEDEFILV